MHLLANRPKPEQCGTHLYVIPPPRVSDLGLLNLSIFRRVLCSCSKPSSCQALDPMTMVFKRTYLTNPYATRRHNGSFSLSQSDGNIQTASVSDSDAEQEHNSASALLKEIRELLREMSKRQAASGTCA